MARRDHSVQEMRQALLGEGHAESEVEEALRRLGDSGYLDDAAFAAGFARRRIAGRGLGSNRVRADLLARGVERRVAEVGLAQALEDVSEAQALEALARRYWRRHRREEGRRRLRRLWAFLLQRGFPDGLARERLCALWPRWSDALDDDGGGGGDDDRLDPAVVDWKGDREDG